MAIRDIRLATCNKCGAHVAGGAGCSHASCGGMLIAGYQFDIYWSPEGRKIATVIAMTPRAAIRLAPQPYRKYLGEMYATQL